MGITRWYWPFDNAVDVCVSGIAFHDECLGVHIGSLFGEKGADDISDYGFRDWVIFRNNQRNAYASCHCRVCGRNGDLECSTFEWINETEPQGEDRFKE